MVVSCKDCEMDPTCAICMPCFSASNHEGHDYRIHKGGSGSRFCSKCHFFNFFFLTFIFHIKVCDCGDLQAWKTPCSKHSGTKEDFTAEEILDKNLIRSISGTLRGLFLSIINICCYSNTQKLSQSQEQAITTIIEITISISTFGQSFSNLISR